MSVLLVGSQSFYFFSMVNVNRNVWKTYTHRALDLLAILECFSAVHTANNCRNSG